jgi:hypothetical protein
MHTPVPTSTSTSSPSALADTDSEYDDDSGIATNLSSMDNEGHCKTTFEPLESCTFVIELSRKFNESSLTGEEKILIKRRRARPSVLRRQMKRDDVMKNDDDSLEMNRRRVKKDPTHISWSDTVLDCMTGDTVVVPLKDKEDCMTGDTVVVPLKVAGEVEPDRHKNWTISIKQRRLCQSE